MSGVSERRSRRSGADAMVSCPVARPRGWTGRSLLDHEILRLRAQCCDTVNRLFRGTRHRVVTPLPVATNEILTPSAQDDTCFRWLVRGITATLPRGAEHDELPRSS